MKQLKIPGIRKTSLLVLAAILVFAATTARSQTYSVLYNLTVNSADPFSPEWLGLYVQARDGNLYSTSQNGGTFGHGAIFRLTPGGKVTVLHSFSGPDGTVPRGGLTLGTDGSLYGTTCTGGSANAGTVFKITTAGVYNLLHNFNVTDGLCPEAPPVQGRDGNFYGTATQANATVGSFYKMTPAGILTRLFVFDPAHGETPTAITLGIDGNFYGTTRFGGASNDGTVFKITPQGKFTLLHSFNGTDGLDPLGPIIQASDGNFYGTTWQARSIYKMTPAGVVTSLHGFGSAEGSQPTAGLIQGSDGKLYGAAMGAGTGFGNLFQVMLTGTFTLLHDFDGVDGWAPEVTMFQHTSGPFYGSTNAGGTSSKPGGVLYKLDMGLKPFVALVTPFGTVGQVVEILCNGLTGTSGVKFGTAAASFTVVSDTYLTAVVPGTGTTGPVTVTTPSGIRVSSKNFRVLPVISSFSPTSGAVGTSVVIKGTGLTQATKVTFGGVKATSFTVNSATQVTATVPTGAITGKIQVTTPGGTATSSGTFATTIVVTQSGAVQGVFQGDLLVFRGIPYSAPPVGNLRWRPPQQPARWSGIKDFSSFGNLCTQINSDNQLVGNEDCLVLNIFISQNAQNSKPVMVFFHGGGNGRGGTDGPPFDTPPLATHGVIVVTAEYRLGLLGFFANSLLTTEGGGTSGNYGLLDQIAALKWVQQNIAAFGGDPRHVMVFGQSAGSYDVHALLVAPAARGLFSVAGMESGAIPNKQLPTLSTLEANDEQFVSLVGCDKAADVLACLRALPADTIVNSQAAFRPFIPNIGPGFLPADPFTVLQQHGSPVPLLIGSTREEAAGFKDDPNTPLDANGYVTAIHTEFDPFGAGVADHVLTLYPASAYDTPEYALIAVDSDFIVTCEVRNVARVAAGANRPPVWRYLYTHSFENDASLAAFRAFHRAELFFVFGNLQIINGPYTPTAAELTLADQMMGYWTRLAATGDPNGAGATQWPRYDATTDSMLQLDDTMAVIDGYHNPQCDYLSTLPQP